MGRPCEYDENRALDGAMFVFWQKGFGGTTISDLEAATGMNRQSIYNAFGDKRELYALSLARYRKRFAEMMAPLVRDDAGLPELRLSLLRLLGAQREHGCGACMVVRTAFDRQVDDPEIAEAVLQAAHATKAFFSDFLKRGQSRGEVESNADVAALSDYLFTVFNGLSALGQTGATQQEVERALDLSLAAIWKKKPRTRRTPSRGTT